MIYIVWIIAATACPKCFVQKKQHRGCLLFDSITGTLFSSILDLIMSKLVFSVSFKGPQRVFFLWKQVWFLPTSIAFPVQRWNVFVDDTSWIFCIITLFSRMNIRDERFTNFHESLLVAVWKRQRGMVTAAHIYSFQKMDLNLMTQIKIKFIMTVIIWYVHYQNIIAVLPIN